MTAGDGCVLMPGAPNACCLPPPPPHVLMCGNTLHNTHSTCTVTCLSLPQRGSEVFVLRSVCFISACKRERVSALRSMGLSSTLCRGEVWSSVGRSSCSDLSKSVLYCQTIIDLNKSLLAGRTLDFSFFSLCKSG